MKYHITIEGGFTGIPKSYDGELNSEGDDARLLRSSLDSSGVVADSPWPDAFHYHIVLKEGSSEREAHFSESNLPTPIRKFIDSLKNKGDVQGKMP